MHFELIKAELRIAGFSLVDVAKDLNVSHTTLRLVMHGAGTSRRVATRIGEIIGRSPNEIWPGKYPELEREAA